MRLNRRAQRLGVLAAISIVTVGWSACSGKKVTEYVAGFSAQVQVPRDLQSIVIRVDANGQNVFQLDYPVDNGVARLPRSLGIQQFNVPEGVPINVSVWGFDITDTALQNTMAVQLQTKPSVGPSANGGARLLRASRQPYVEGQVIYLPMPIHYSCYDVDCSAAANPGNTDCQPDDCTCKAGLCVSPTTDQTQLPPYDDSLINGTTNTCFRPFTDVNASGQTEPGCMDPLIHVLPGHLGIAPQPIDQTNCIFALPGSSSVPADAGAYVTGLPQQITSALEQGAGGSGLNVRVVYDNKVSEVLDYEGACPANGAWPPATGQAPQEGYCTYPGAPQEFRLAQGLCNMLNGTLVNGQAPAHQITLLETTGTCPPKTALQPICQDNVCTAGQECPAQPTLSDGGSSTDGICNVDNILTPAPSALYILFDRSSGMRDFFGTAFANVLGLQLGNPVFQQTQIAMMYTPAQASDCTAAGTANEYANPGGPGIQPGSVAFASTATAQGSIANSLSAQNLTDGGTYPSGAAPWYLEAALAGAYTALDSPTLQNQSQLNRRAVMLFLDRDFNVDPSNGGTGKDCTGGTDSDAITEAANALTNAAGPVETYVVYLANADYIDGGVPGNPVAHATSLAHGLTSNQYFFNASSQTSGAAAAAAAEALASVTADLGSCVYEVPSNLIPGVAMNFTDFAPVQMSGNPSSAVNVAVQYSTNGCAADDAVNNPLWVYDNQHVRICQNTCQRVVASVVANELITEERNAVMPPPVPAIPLLEPKGVSWFVGCGSTIPDAGIVESGSAPTGTGGDAGGATLDGGAGITDASTGGG